MFALRTLWRSKSEQLERTKDKKATQKLARWSPHACMHGILLFKSTAIIQYVTIISTFVHNSIIMHYIIKKCLSTWLCRALFVASVVLLPILGLTWVFGILTVNANSTIFAWLFTIFNSLQVSFNTVAAIYYIVYRILCGMHTRTSMATSCYVNFLLLYYYIIDIIGNVHFLLPCSTKW
jgi:TctA family transporter